MTTVCIGIEGVLAKGSSAPLVQRQRQVDAQALRLYENLSTGYRVVLLSSEPARNERFVQHWLFSVGIKRWDDLVYAAEDAVDLTDLRFRQVTGMRAGRADVALFIEADPLVVTMAAQQGIPSMLWLPARPALMRGDLQPRKIRNWDAVVGEIEDQKTFAESRGE